ncbi:hypothetical protein [Allofranklinella schreckenbergeri]|uniref:hypothetical protein n=1 Tax=Allofranklinella schreckenbergeri TaxID=1076744 RepID=UPI0011C3A700|nr:hypothetical protein [Allofranklinella schreckenbergeri]
MGWDAGGGGENKERCDGGGSGWAAASLFKGDWRLQRGCHCHACFALLSFITNQKEIKYPYFGNLTFKLYLL